MSVEIEIVPCLKDNYAYLLKSANSCAVIDPSEPGPVKQALARRGWALTHILNTHHHLDHTGGNLELKSQFGTLVVGPGKDRARIPGIDIGVDEKSGWEFDGHRVEVLEVPGHTLGAITFVIRANAFTGDTLFAMGCGRLFEGNAPMMWNSLCKLMRLPDATKIWCGHEYTQNNARFALTLEPNNKDLIGRMVEVDALRGQAKPTLPSTLAIEKKTNPFLRPHSSEIRTNLGMSKSDDVTIFGAIRLRKDNF